MKVDGSVLQRETVCFWRVTGWKRSRKVEIARVLQLKGTVAKAVSILLDEIDEAARPGQDNVTVILYEHARKGASRPSRETDGEHDAEAIGGRIGPAETRGGGKAMTDHGFSLAPGNRIREFRIEKELGAGGFGVTYLAWDEDLERWVALKEYLPREWGTRLSDGSVGPGFSTEAHYYQWGLKKFLEEARTLARLNHPQIVRVYQVMEVHGTAYMAMEYVEGRSLKSELESVGRLGEGRVREILDALMSGLETVHACGILPPRHKASQYNTTSRRQPTGADRFRSGAAEHEPGVALATVCNDTSICPGGAIRNRRRPRSLDGHLRGGGVGIRMPDRRAPPRIGQSLP